MTTIGEGGCGKAKRVKWHGRDAVVKYINAKQDPSATLATCTLNRDLAREEGRIMSLFKNRDSIAEIYSVEGHAIYMKYYPEGSLRSQLDQDNVYQERYFMLDDIIAGLNQIHGLNFVHSDLKASNILCETYERIRCRITDFGAAGKKGSNPYCYTEGFVPPDFLKKPLCFEDDIYSLGKLCIELFTGIDDIRGINYNNFNKIMNPSDFTNNKNATNETKHYRFDLMDLVHECLNPDSSQRPSLKDFYDFISSYGG